MLIDFWIDFGPIWGVQEINSELGEGALRNARALARLFDFEEFERLIRCRSSHAPTLRVAADLTAQRAVRRPALQSADEPRVEGLMS